MSAIDPSFLEGGGRVPEPNADRAEERLASALRELHGRSEKIVKDVHQLTRPPQGVLVGALVGAVVLGGLFFALRSRRRRRPARRLGAGERVGREVGQEIASRVLAAAASVVVARLTEDVLLPMVRERLAPHAGA